MAIGVAVTTTISAFTANPSAQAAPPDFPDVDAPTMVSPADFFVPADQPENAGWRFSTARGVRCDMHLNSSGTSCEYPTSTVPLRHQLVTAAASFPGTILEAPDGAPDVPAAAYPLLRAGMRLTTNHGATCAVLTDDTMACRLRPPPAWMTGHHEADSDASAEEHGFVLTWSGRSFVPEDLF